MQVRESPLRDLGRLLVWYPLRWLIGALPVGLAFRLFEALGDLHHRLRGPSPEVAEALGRVGLSSGAAPRRYLQNHYVDRLHIFCYPQIARWGREQLDQLIALEGEERLAAALKEGKGAILLQGHYGPIQLPLFALRAYRLNQVALLTDEGLSGIGRTVAFAQRQRLESLLPATFFRAGGFPRPLFRALRNNELVLMSGDGTGGGRFVGAFADATLLGQPCRLPIGPYELALKTGAPLLPCFLQRRGPGAYAFEIGQPLQSLVGEVSIETLQRAFLDQLEAALAADPGLWHFWDEFRPGMLLAQEPENS